MYNILVVDDEQNIADGVAGSLSSDPETEAEIAVCYGAQAAKEYAEEHFIDVIVCDIDMPRQNGLSLCRELLGRFPELKIVFLTGYSDFSYTYEALKFPDVSYVLKLEDDEVLLKAVREKLCALEKERVNRAELLREKAKNRQLETQLGDLRLGKAVAAEGDHTYDGSYFVLMRFSREIPFEQVRLFASGAFAEGSALTGGGTLYLAALSGKERVTVELAKRLQQTIFDLTGICSTFMLDRPCGADAAERYALLKRKSSLRGQALIFLESGEGSEREDLREEEGVISNVKEYIAAHLSEELSLTSLSERIHYNPAYLSRKFKQATGENLHSYILTQRMEQAKKLLKETDLFIQEIALRCGVPNPTQFGIVFSRYTGSSPSAFRRKDQS